MVFSSGGNLGFIGLGKYRCMNEDCPALLAKSQTVPILVWGKRARNDRI